MHSSNENALKYLCPECSIAWPQNYQIYHSNVVMTITARFKRVEITTSVENG